MEHSIISVCISAGIAIFIILPMLAVIMHLIVKIFPKEIRIESGKKEIKSDTALYAAINTAYQNIYPGMKVKEIVENK